MNGGLRSTKPKLLRELHKGGIPTDLSALTTTLTLTSYYPHDQSW